MGQTKSFGGGVLMCDGLPFSGDCSSMKGSGELMIHQEDEEELMDISTVRKWIPLIEHMSFV